MIKMDKYIEGKRYLTFRYGEHEIISLDFDKEIGGLYLWYFPTGFVYVFDLDETNSIKVVGVDIV